MNDLINFFKDHYPSDIILSLTIGFIIVSIFSDFSKILDSFKQLFSKRKRKEISKDDLKKHYIFTHINYLKNIKINMLKFGDSGRNYLIKLLITHKLNYIEQALYEFIDETDFDHITNYDLETKIIQLYNNSISMYLTDFKKEAHTYEEEQIVQLVIDTLWLKYNDPQGDFGIKGIQDVISSTIYASNILKIHSLLLPLTVSLDVFLIKCEKTLYNLNGQLTGRTFHGITFK